MKRFVKKAEYVLWPALLTAVLLFAVYLFNGIFPFGKESVIYNDLGQTTLPTYYQVWDVIHGEGSALLSWNTGGGVFVNSILTAIINPVNFLFFLICPRSAIFNGMSFLLMIKLSLAAATAYLFFDRKFKKLDYYWKLIFSVMYAFSPYVLQYYTNAEWLDVVVLFPLIILFLDVLFEKRRILPYVVVLTLTLVQSLYISYMVFLFLFIVGGLYIFIVIDKDKRRTSAFDFGVGSLFSLLISAVVTLPSYSYMSSTSRYDERKTLIEIFNNTDGVSYQKFGMIVLLSALPIALMLLMTVNIKKDKRRVSFLLAAFAVCFLPIVFENINLFWHMGSYMKFPMRFAFMLTFVLLSISAYTCERYKDKLFDFKLSRIPIMVAAFGFGGYAAYLMFAKIYADANQIKMVNDSNFINITIAFVCLITFYFVMITLSEAGTAYAFISIMLVIEIVVNAGAAVTTGNTRFREYRLNCISICDEIREELPLENDGITRLKTANSTLNTNYPLILGYPSMSNFTHVLPADLQDTMDALGYSTVYTRILDAGGTPFTDALLNIKNTLSISELSGDIYSSVKDVGEGYTLYNNKFTLPFGIKFTDEKLLCDDILKGDCFEVNNKIYSAISGDDAALFETPLAEKDTVSRSIVYDVVVKGTRRLYIEYSDSLDTRKSTYLYVNGEQLTIESLDELQNKRFNTSFNNKILDLGTYSDETVTIEIAPVNSTVEVDADTVHIALMDMEKLGRFCSSYDGYKSNAKTGERTLSMSVESDGDEYVFLPITHDNGWSCALNGRKADIQTAVGSFMAIKLEKGTNEIELSFYPTDFITGAVVSAVSAVLFILYLVLFKKLRFVQNDGGLILKSVEKLYGVALIFVITVMYALSMLCTALNLLIDLIQN